MNDAIEEKYARSLKILHWLMALAFIFMWSSGIIMTDLEWGVLKNTLYISHKSTGIVLIAAALLRLVVRYSTDIPDLPRSISGLAQSLARIVQALMYVLMFVVPITGWLMSDIGGHPVKFYDQFLIPTVFDKDPGLAKDLNDIHTFFAFAFLTLAGLHLAGFLKHLIFDKKNLIKRMI